MPIMALRHILIISGVYFIVIATLIFATDIQAQNTSTDAAAISRGLPFTDMREITVTATRTKREVRDVPESVSVVDTEQIQTRQATDISDVLRYVPNVELEGGPRNLGLNPNVRGLGAERILFLLDGARQDFMRGHNSRIFIDPLLLKQVDVVRGPASSTWGSGALGGVISFTTLDATDLLRQGERHGAKIRGGFQSMNEHYAPGTSLYGLIGDKFDYLLDFSYRNAADDIRHGDGSKLQNSSFESYASLAKLNWTPGHHQFMFSAQTFDQIGHVPSNVQGPLSRANQLVDRETEQRNYTLRYQYQNPDNIWLNPEILAYLNTTRMLEKRISDQRRDETDFSTTGINIRNSSRFETGSALTQLITYGVDYFHNEAKGLRNRVTRPEFPRGKADVVGVYLQDEILLWDRLSLIPGVRWDYFSSQADNPALSANRNDRVNFKMGGIFSVTDWLSITGSYNEAFRAPNLGELFTTGTHFTCGPMCANLFVPNPNLRPETAFNKEVGLRIQKSDLLYNNDRLTIRSAYFNNDVKDFIDLIVDFTFLPVPGNPGRGGVTTSDNVRNAVLDGYEVEANYAARYGYVGFSYTQTRGRNRTTGAALSNVLPDKWIALSGLTLPSYNLTLEWRSSIVNAQNRVPVGGMATPGYTLHDLTLTWLPQHNALKGLRFDFGIDNLTDENYRRHLAVLRDPGRNYKLMTSYQF